MTKKYHGARRNAFLRALRQTGNQTLAAERAKVSRSWVQLHRSSDAAFARAMEGAIADAADKLGGSLRPHSRWGFLDGAELVVRGASCAGGGRQVQITRARLKQWTPRTEDRFLEVLGSTCNVRAAASAVGLCPTSAYNQRRRWPAFARRWRAALEQGYLELEFGLLEAAGNFLSGEDVPDPAPLTGMTVNEAMHLLYMHQHTVRGIGKPQVSHAREPDIEDIRASILHKIEVIEQSKARCDARRLERNRQEWARRRRDRSPE
jgi:hypothetical protein